MAYLKTMFFITLIFTIAISISIAQKETERHRRESSETHRRENSVTKSDDDSDYDDGDDSDEGSEPDNGEGSDVERYLRDLCSETKISKRCWKILKPELNRFSHADSRSVAGVIFDLAIAKSDEINSQLKQLNQDSNDETLKKKYSSCARNYEDANRDLTKAMGKLDSDGYRSIPSQVDDVKGELKSCKHEFKKDSFDPAHIRNRNHEFEAYVDIVRVAADHFIKDKNNDHDQAAH